MNRKAIIFLITVVILGIIALPTSFYSDRPLLTRIDVLSLGLFAFLTTIAECYPIIMQHRRESNELTVSTAFHFALIVLFPPSLAALSCAMASVIADIFHRKPWFKVLFNAAEYTLAVLAAGYMLEIFGYTPEVQFIRGLPILLVAALTYYTLNSFLVSTMVAFAQESSPLDIYLTNIKMQTFAHITIFALGVLMVMTYRIDPASMPLMFLPMIAIYFAYKNYIDLQVQAKNTIESLAEAIDKRDPYTRRHSERVAHYAAELAKAVGMKEEEIFNLISAARIHDIGKIGIDDSTLYKKGDLTHEEIKRIQEHPLLGKSIVSNLEVYKRSLSIIAHHHERYDGRGYPDGLKGKEIPLAARILAIADAYDAMLSDRPYRKPLSKEEAIERLKREAGSQFDPYLVWSFIHLLIEEIEGQLKEEEQDVSTGSIIPLYDYSLSSKG